MAALQHQAAELDELAASLERDGICVLKGALDKSVVEGWAESITALLHERHQRPGGLAPRGKGRFYLTLPWVSPFADPNVFGHPAVHGILNRVLGTEYAMVQLGADIPVKGSVHQETHRDHPPLFSEGFHTPLYAIAANFPLCDVTDENGPLEMALGTHRMPKEAALAKIASGEIAMQTFRMSAGDILLRAPLALHRGSPNLTTQPRPMVVMGFVRRWLHTPKTEMDVPRAYYATLPERLQTMLRCNLVDELADRSCESYIEFQY